jgi:hypothetical protein
MKTNIAFFHGNAASPVLEASRAANVTDFRRVARGQVSASTCAPVRPVLKMIWRVHPTTGRLECHWESDGGTATDEGVSGSPLVRRAA